MMPSRSHLNYEQFLSWEVLPITPKLPAQTSPPKHPSTPVCVCSALAPCPLTCSSSLQLSSPISTRMSFTFFRAFLMLSRFSTGTWNIFETFLMRKENKTVVSTWECLYTCTYFLTELVKHYGSFSTNDAGTTGHPDARMKLQSLLISNTKINSKWVAHLHIGDETLKL